MNHVKSLLAFIILGWLIQSGCSARPASVIDTAAPNAEGINSMRPEVPEEYSGMVNPLTNHETDIPEGRTLFESNCSSCHGINGEGDGPAAAGLEPPPQNLSQNQADLSDEYLFWRISEGGLMEPFDSVMPAWRGILNEDQIWQIITFLRTL